jgi:hypothetical protein
MTFRKLLLPLLMCWASAGHAVAIDPLTIDIDVSKTAGVRSDIRTRSLPYLDRASD